jgi:hypothetical protein
MSDTCVQPLDTQIAERLFGQHVTMASCACPRTHIPSVKPYSTEMWAAWEVVQRLQKRGMQVNLVVSPNGFTRATLCCLNIPSQSAIAEGSSAPEAICLAALDMEELTPAPVEQGIAPGPQPDQELLPLRVAALEERVRRLEKERVRRLEPDQGHGLPCDA